MNLAHALPGRTAISIGAIYLVVAVATIGSTRFGGGAAVLSLASSVLIAGLIVSPRRQWPGILISCACASTVASATVGVGPAAAPMLAVANILEGLIAALLIKRFRLQRDPLDSLGSLGLLVLAVGVIAPAAVAPAAAALIAHATGTSFAVNLVLWFTGHGLGNITAAPVFTLVASGAVGRWVGSASRERRLEAAGLLALVVAVTGSVFAQALLPLLFLPVLPAIVAAFRLGRIGAAASVAIIAVVGGAFSAAGSGPVMLVAGDPTLRALFFLFYLAVTVLTVLPVAAELRHRRTVFDRLRESEARYRLLADHSSDIVLNLDAEGFIRYASPSIARIGGHDPDAVIGMCGTLLVLPEYRKVVTEAHLAAMADPDRTVTVEYRAATADGEVRWFEIRTRGVRDETGAATGAVAAIRDIDHRKAVEGELSHAAATDPLTALANRRVFDAALGRMLAGEGGGCVAILDLDHFKSVNDRHGHEAGDRLLVAVAEGVRGALRDGDLIARLGGEEFGVLLPAADREHARAVCERLRRIVAEARVPVTGGVVQVTASVGIATAFPGTERTAVLRAADEALYRAKAEGRDRVALAA
ncbi:diguanylate cyclase domain-containing protein [uncultured Sphingomonas sp.]|uniref:sensor domain-containing diguanylate cyclase n=1 Tax=uncultured Sphingomonas sp. TaxID=158754 RepID=UPI0035CADBAE